ncbi:hypothetical protein ACEVHA_028090 [Klebsiella pneumoniae]
MAAGQRYVIQHRQHPKTVDGCECRSDAAVGTPGPREKQQDNTGIRAISSGPKTVHRRRM